MECCPVGEIIRDLLTKSNEKYIFRRFRDLIMVVIPQTEPRNGKQGNSKNKEAKKIKQELESN